MIIKANTDCDYDYCLEIADGFDPDGELKLEIEYENYGWLDREGVEKLRDHLTKVLGDE